MKCVQDNVSGWCVYHKGKGVLLTPAPRCLPEGWEPGIPKKTGGLGYSGDIGAGVGGSLSSARRAAILGALTGPEVAGVQAQITAGAQNAPGGATYGRIAAAVYAGDPEKYTPPQLGFGGPGAIVRPVAPTAIARFAGGKLGGGVGPSVREGCACKPRPCDAVDPVSSWCIYYVNGGVLLTTSLRCLPGGGALPNWLRTTWRNIVTLFTVPGAAIPAGFPAPTLKGLDAIAAQITAAEGPVVCVPDEIISRDTSPFGSGWFRVKRGGVEMMVPNPKTCP